MEYLFEGNISVKAALMAHNRQVNKILVDKDKNDKDTFFILKKAEEQNVEIIKTTREEIDEMAEGKTHGGLVAYCAERNYQTTTDLKNHDFLAVLDGIEDPFNFGYCLRNLYAAGCKGIIVNKRNWYEEAAVIAKSSAGASEYLDVIQTDDFNETLKEFVKDYEIVAAERKDATSLYDCKFSDRLIICIGGEKRGLSKAVKSNVTKNIYIPYGNNFRNALNASSATAVFAFEILRQRLNKDGNNLPQE